MQALRNKILSYVNIPEEELTFTLQFFKKLELNKGEFLLREGQYADRLFFLETGCICAYTIVDGKESVIEFYTEGNVFTELFSYLRDVPTKCFFKSLEPALVWYIPKRDFFRVYDKSHAIERFGRKYLEEEHIKLLINSTNKNTISNEKRYLWLIKKRPDLIQRVPQYLIASYLGLTPVGLSKIRKRLSEY